jgi:hypothetical protein
VKTQGEGPTQIDDAGQPLARVGSGALSQELKQDPKARAMVMLLAGRLQHLLSIQGQSVALGAVVAVGGLLLFGIGLAIGWWPVAVLVFVASMVLFAMIILGANRPSTNEIAEDLRESSLAYGRCVGCGYLLDGLEADESVLKQCPECGARWRADRLRFSLRGHELEVASNHSGGRLVVAGAPPVLIDESGKLHWAADPRLPGAEQSLGDRARDVRRVVRRRTMGWRVLSLLIGLWPIAFLLMIMIVFLLSGPSSWMSILPFILFLPFGGISSVRSVLNWRSYRTPWLCRQAAQCLLDEGVCPSCGHGLSLRPAETEGSVRCEYCDGLWSARLANQTTLARRSAQPAS